MNIFTLNFKGSEYNNNNLPFRVSLKVKSVLVNLISVFMCLVERCLAKLQFCCTSTL